MKEEKKKFWISLFIVFLMIGGPVGYMIGKDGAQKEKYNDYSFMLKGDKWVSEVDDVEASFEYLPQQVEVINLSSEIVDRLSNTLEIDSTSDVNDPYTANIAEAQFELEQTLNSKNVYLRIGMTDENEYNLPVMTCDDATVQIPIIYFKEANQTEILLEGDCIIANAKTESDFIAIKDRLLYGILGIIP